MNSAASSPQEAIPLLKDLYDHIILEQIPRRPPYGGYVDREHPFALDEHGYYTAYMALLRYTYSLPNVAKSWSEDGLQELAHALLVRLADHKIAASAPIDFEDIANSWLSDVHKTFPEHTCFTPIVGLAVEQPLQVGAVRFLPLEQELARLRANAPSEWAEELHPFRDCLASSSVVAEWRKAAEVIRQRAEEALNVLRFLGSLVWWNQPTKHIYVAGRERKRISYTPCFDTTGHQSSVGASEYDPVPFRVDSEFLIHAQFYRFDQISQMLMSPSPSEIQHSLLTAIQWYGDATQDLTPLFAFVKYYVAIEAALKKPGEWAKSVIPRRLSVLISPWSAEDQQLMEKDIGDMIDERNSVLHTGQPVKSNPETLAWSARIMARQCLHQLRERISSQNLTSKDELIAWVADQNRRFLTATPWR